MFVATLFVQALLAAAALAPVALAAPWRRQDSDSNITAVPPAEIASFAPYTHFASTAYCTPNTTLAWDCGANCDANPLFQPVASGGDGVITQFCESAPTPFPPPFRRGARVLWFWGCVRHDACRC